MALGKIKADTLEHSTAGTVDTQYVVKGTPKIWVTAAQHSSASIKDSLNVSSMTDTSTGLYRFVLSNAFTDTNRSEQHNGSVQSSSDNYHTSGCTDDYTQVQSASIISGCTSIAGALVDCETLGSLALGDLA